MGFVRKVFGIVAAQLICTILVTAFVMSNPGLKLILQQSQKFSFFSFLATMGTLVALLANRKKSPLNMQLLAAFVSERSYDSSLRLFSAPPPKRSAPIPDSSCSMPYGLQLTTFFYRSGHLYDFLQTVLESIAVATVVSFYDQTLVLQVRGLHLFPLSAAVRPLLSG